MFELLQMWALVEVLSFICLPLTITVFHNLPDRGWAFSKAIGVALLAFCVWLPLMLLHALPFSQLFIAGVLLILLAFNLFGFIRVRHAITKLVRVNRGYIVICEAVFLGMVFLLGWIRSYGPDIQSFEMFMDEGFLSAIMRSPHFPPNDMWLAGYPINYYYYAHYTIAVLAKLLGQSPSIAFNTGICIFFGLTAVNLFGVSCNIVSWARYLRKRNANVRTQFITSAQNSSTPTADRPDTVHPTLLGGVPYGLLTMLMGLVLGNLASTQQWWQAHGDLPPYYWFNSSRVIDKTINEFPAFSFLLSCFHAHVLTLAFTILGIALAFNLFLEQDGKGLGIFGRGWRMPITLGTTALIIGGLFTMNGWDFPTYLGIALICIVLQQWLASGSHFSIDLVLDIFTAGAALASLSFLLYAPFYLSFISPSQGIGIVGPADRSPIGNEVLIYGLFAFVFLSLVEIAFLTRPTLPLLYSNLNGSISLASDETNSASQLALSSHSTKSRLSNLHLSWPVGFVLLIALGIVALIVIKNSLTFVVTASFAVLGAVMLLYHLRNRSQAFTLLLGAVAFGLVAVCEIFFLKDVFAGSFPRMNTVFKFYFQSWALLSITSGAGLYFILEAFRPGTAASQIRRRIQRSGEVLWVLALIAFLLAGAVYPLVGSYQRTNHYAHRTNSLDGLTYMQQTDPGDYAAIRWLNSHIQGDPVIVEAVGDDYSNYARISAFTGLPTIMGWVGHEYQWRVNWLNNGLNAADFYRRGADIDTIYTSKNPAEVLTLLAHYQAQYLYVGPLEQAKYLTANLHRFSSFMQVVYSAQGVTIYKVK